MQPRAPLEALPHSLRPLLPDHPADLRQGHHDRRLGGSSVVPGGAGGSAGSVKVRRACAFQCSAWDTNRLDRGAHRLAALTVPSGSVRAIASNTSAEIAKRIIKCARKTDLS